MFKAKGMRAQGKSLRTVARHFGIGASTLHRLLAEDVGASTGATEAMVAS
jgi:hypothetical protein